MVAKSTRVAQVEDLVASIDAEDSAVQTSVSEPSAVEFVVAPIAAETTIITIPEVLAPTSASKEPVVSLSLHKLSRPPSLWILLVLS